MKALTTKDFVERATKLHKNKYTYDNSVYTKSGNKIIVTCKVHGDFEQKAVTHLQGFGCSRCSLASKMTTEIFIEKAVSIHGNTYIYDKVLYKTALHKVIITCKEHGDFKQTSSIHFAGKGCPKCTNKGYSRLSIKWIEEKAKSLRLKNVRHALNGGEYRIPDTNFRVDGYHENTKTVFEFHGDAYHGNPEKYEFKTRCHPYKKDKTAAQLFAATLERDNIIKSLGYNLIKIWESDYREGLRINEIRRTEDK